VEAGHDTTVARWKREKEKKECFLAKTIKKKMVFACKKAVQERMWCPILFTDFVVCVFFVLDTHITVSYLLFLN